MQRVRAQLVVGSWAWCEHVTDREELERQFRLTYERVQVRGRSVSSQLVADNA